jgi:hypothetical protein
MRTLAAPIAIAMESADPETLRCRAARNVSSCGSAATASPSRLEQTAGVGEDPYCYSPSLVPTPADWPPDAVATGYWLRKRGDSAGPAGVGLESFVVAGRHRSTSASAAASDPTRPVSARLCVTRCGRSASAR